MCYILAFVKTIFFNYSYASKKELNLFPKEGVHSSVKRENLKKVQKPNNKKTVIQKEDPMK